MIVSLVGGVILLASALLFVCNLLALHRRSGARGAGQPIDTPSRSIRRTACPRALNGFALWNVLVRC